MSVKQFGPDLLRDQTNFREHFTQEYRKADDFEKVGLLRKKNERQNAVEIIFNLIMSKLSEEVKQLVVMFLDRTWFFVLTTPRGVLRLVSFF